MKHLNLLFLIIFLTSSVSVVAQAQVSYGYDDAGNRILYHL